MLAFLIFPLSARAEDFDLKMSAGALAFMAPRYEGSDQYGAPGYLPIFDLQYGPLFASVVQGAGLYLPANAARTIIFAPAVRWRARRNLHDYDWDTLEYIDNIRPTATLNTIVKLDPWIFNFRMTDGTTADNKGSVYNLGITWTDWASEKIHLAIYGTAMFGSRSYNQTYYGITARESAKFGFDEYHPGAGLKSLDIGGIVKYFTSEKFSINVIWEYMYLVGPAAASPTTKDANQFRLGLGAEYYF
ncbi:MAG: MipA/OmpV family protein [Rickettsiales bacterium]|nr:MipA/OmpV family protein [Rickettsiales bacterium]